MLVCSQTFRIFMLTISEILQTEKDARRLLASRWFRLDQHILHTSPLLRIGSFNSHVQLYHLGLRSDS